MSEEQKKTRVKQEEETIYVLVLWPSYIKETSHRALIRFLRQSRNSGGSTDQVIALD